MKKSILMMALGLVMTTGAAMAQSDVLASTLAITLSPTITVVRLLDTTSATVATGSLASLGSSAASFAATIESVESKGINAKAELREEATIVIDNLTEGRQVKLKNFKTLAAAIADLKNNDAASAEISEAAHASQVSFEVMAVKAIMLATEL